MINKLKSEKAAISMYVTVACLFVMVVGMSTYVLSNNKQQTQLAQLAQIEEEYKTGLTEEELYNSYKGGDIIPVYTEEQFLKIGTGQELYIDGKIYVMAANKTYVLYENWEANSKYSNIATTVETANGVLIKDY